MAETLICADGDVISLAEYVDYVRSEVNLADAESLRGSGSMLRRLSLNTSLLNSILLDAALNKSVLIQSDNLYADQTLILHRDERFFIRANIWSPRLRSSLDSERSGFSYEVPHDHNFDFLTVGYYGPGYTTRIFRYDYEKCSDVVGDKVDLEFLEETTLPPQKVMFYRKSEDVHTQLPPDELSISINLMIKNPPLTSNRQMELDMNGTITRLISPDAVCRAYFVSLCGHLGDESFLEPLEDLVKGDCAQTSASALLAIERLDVSYSGKIASDLQYHSSPLVATTARDIVSRIN